MKKSYLITSALLCMAGVSLNGKTLEEARIYINPGHGSWGPNDRPMATIPYPNLSETGRPDTCGFYESNTNLWKALKVAEVLEKLGTSKSNIMLSRTKNGPFPYVKGAEDESLYNRSLTEICEEVDANNMDYFLSIHSNAASEGTATNYPLFLYRGKDNGDDYAPGSYDMCTLSWPFLHSNEIDPTTAYATSSNIRGDISFYGSSSDRPGSNGETYTGYLGVMKHGCPGYLSEGYFHTYQPARHRALNRDYCAQEGVRYARGIAGYFGAEGETSGYIMGTVKDLHEKIVNPLFKYAPGSDDQWMPLNGATVELYKGETKVQEYQVDKNYNGIFVFEGLAPGEYTLNYICDGYKPAGDEYKTPVKVAGNATSYVKAYLESVDYVPPTPPTVIYTNYPDPEQDSDLRVADTYNFSEEFWGNEIVALEDKTIRRAILRGDSLFVLALDEANVPFLYMINPETQELIRTLNTPAVNENSIYTLSDIAFTADGVLCGCNMEETQFTPNGTFRVYKWSDYDADPEIWFTSKKSGNFSYANTGNTLAISGDSQNCKVFTSATTTGSTKAVRILIFNIEDGVNTTDIRNQDGSNYSAIAWGEDFSFSVSPRNDERLIIDGSATTPIEYEVSGTDVTAMRLVGKWNHEKLTPASNGATYFKYAGNALMAAPFADEEGWNEGIALFDITEGLDKAKLIETQGMEGSDPGIMPLNNAPAHYAMGAAQVNNADITLYLVEGSAPSTLTKYTTMGVEQPVVKGVFAYDLDVESNETTHTFRFNATDEAVSGRLIFTDAATGAIAGSMPIEMVMRGGNSIAVNKDQIPYGEKLNWAVELSNHAIPRVTRLTEKSAEYAFIRAIGVTVDKSPESAHFGNIYVGSNKAGDATGRSVEKGIYVFAPDLTSVNAKAFTGGETWNSNWRMGIDAKGKVYISEWADGHSGIFIADPDNLEGAFKQLFREGTRNADGLFSNSDGIAMGGSTTSAAILGSGAATKLYTFDEDYIINGKGNNVLCYNLGEADVWNAAPSATYAVGALEVNGNAHIVPDEEGGVWVSQVRSSGNNTPSVPSLIYADATGKVLFNSGNTLAKELDGSGGAGFTLSPDGKELIINNCKGEVIVFDLSWNEGVPSLAKKYSFKHNLGSADLFQMDFDYAGNLVASGVYMGVFSLPKEDNRVTTPARAEFAIDGRKMEIVAPTNALATENEDGTVTLTWSAPATDAEITYNLYLDNEKVDTAEGNATSYTFDRPESGEHRFGVTAVYPNEQESEAAVATLDIATMDESVTAMVVSAYPNPTTGIVRLAGVEENQTIRVFNMTGALVLEGLTPEIDLSDLSAGNYLLQIGERTIRVIKK